MAAISWGRCPKPMMSLDTGFFVGADHVVIRTEENPVEETEIGVQHSGSLFCKGGIARKEPTTLITCSQR